MPSKSPSAPDRSAAAEARASTESAVISPPKSASPVTPLVADASPPSRPPPTRSSRPQSQPRPCPGRRSSRWRRGPPTGGAATTVVPAPLAPGTTIRIATARAAAGGAVGSVAAPAPAPSAATATRPSAKTTLADNASHYAGPGKTAPSPPDLARRRPVRQARAVDALAQLTAEPERAAIFLDVDGTLAPIVDDPDDSRVPGRDPRRAGAPRRPVRARRVRQRPLRRPRPGDRRCSRADLRRRARPRARPGGSGSGRRESTPSPPKPAGRPRTSRSRPRSTTARRRTTTEARRVLEGVERAARAEGFRTRWGRLVLEVLPPLETSKGTAVRRLLTAHGLTRALYAGDDSDRPRRLRRARRSRGGGASGGRLDRGAERPCRPRRRRRRLARGARRAARAALEAKRLAHAP